MANIINNVNIISDIINFGIPVWQNTMHLRIKYLLIDVVKGSLRCIFKWKKVQIVKNKSACQYSLNTDMHVKIHIGVMCVFIY